MTLKTVLAVCALSALSLPARAEVVEKTTIGRWTGGALVNNGTVTQCVLGTRIKGDGADPGFAVFQSVSKASGWALAVQDPAFAFQPGRQVDSTVMIDGKAFAGIEGKAVAAPVVASYPKDVTAFKAALSSARLLSIEIAGSSHVVPVEVEPAVVTWLEACAKSHGLGEATFEAGRAEEEKKLGN